MAYYKEIPLAANIMTRRSMTELMETHASDVDVLALIQGAHRLYGEGVEAAGRLGYGLETLRVYVWSKESREVVPSKRLSSWFLFFDGRLWGSGWGLRPTDSSSHPFGQAYFATEDKPNKGVDHRRVPKSQEYVVRVARWQMRQEWTGTCWDDSVLVQKYNHLIRCDACQERTAPERLKSVEWKDRGWRVCGGCFEGKIPAIERLLLVAEGTGDEALISKLKKINQKRAPLLQMFQALQALERK